MIDFLKKYKAFGIGFIIVSLAILLMHHYKLILVPDDAPLEIVFVFTFWWLLVSLPIYKFSYIKKKKKVIYKIFGLIILFITAMVIDSNMRMPDNPITFLFLMLFFMGMVYLLSPEFFKKYQKFIFIVYGCAMLYFTYVRVFSGNLETYLEFKKEMAVKFFFMPIPLFIVLWAYEQWKWLKTLKSDKTEAELALLKTQINPHFFFNTLNNLYSLTVKHSEKAPDVILKLSDMMRYTIYEGKKEYVPLKEEIEYLKNYIELHKIRYRKEVTFQFNHSINEEDTIAPLLFIILLENAFKHGVEMLTDEAYIKMDLTSDSREIHFTIENNFDPTVTNEESGIGLENLKRRLALIYPTTHKLNITQKENIYKVDLKITMA